MDDRAAPPSTSFIGRSEQLDVIRTCIEAASSASSRVVWIEGEAGSGKTALVRHVLTTLPGEFQVVRAFADEQSADIPFALAAQLGPVTAERPFAAGMELLSSWARLQDRGPVAAVVEDFQWADSASRQALLTAVQRLAEDSVLVLITSRPDAEDQWDRFRLDEDRCRSIFVRDFDVDEVMTLTTSLGYGLTRREADRLHEHTRGHPLYVRTLLAELTLSQLQAPDGNLPAPRSLASTTLARVSELPPEARRLAAAMAVINQRAPLQLVGRIVGLTRASEAFETLLTTGFVSWQPNEPDTPVEFTHPLYRLALYQDISPSRRRDLHGATARVLPTASALAHRVAATEGADDELASDLETTARQEIETGAVGPGSRHLLWASSLSSEPELAERRLLEAAWALISRGQVSQAGALRVRVESCRDSTLRSLVLGMIDWEQGEAASAELWLLRATLVQSEPEAALQAARAWAELSAAYAMHGRVREAFDAAQTALQIAPEGSSTERLAWIGLAMSEGMLRGAPAGLARLQERIPQPADEIAGNEADLLVARGTLGFYAGHTSEGVTDMRGVMRLAREGSVAIQISRSHVLLASLLLNSGEWDEALVHARVGVDMVADERLVWMEAQSFAVLSTILALRGDWDGADMYVTRATAASNEHSSAEAIFTTQLARMAMARAQRRPQQVIEVLAPFPSAIPMLSALTWWPALVAALIETNQIERAEASLAELTLAADARGLDFRARLIALHGRLASAIGRPDDAVADFERALSLFGPGDPFLDWALSHHAYGQVLQSKGDRRDAVAQFRIAHEMLTRAGAAPFVEWVNADLAASGIRSNGAPGRSKLALTDREHDVAVLVAKGLTNPEVAGELYISRKAVEYHLGNIYGKLGIKSRRELRTVSI
jgi:DNA-binding CsgD family transcriptional regulator